MGLGSGLKDVEIWADHTAGVRLRDSGRDLDFVDILPSVWGIEHRSCRWPFGVGLDNRLRIGISPCCYDALLSVHPGVVFECWALFKRPVLRLRYPRLADIERQDAGFQYECVRGHPSYHDAKHGSYAHGGRRIEASNEHGIRLYNAQEGPQSREPRLLEILRGLNFFHMPRTRNKKRTFSGDPQLGFDTRSSSSTFVYPWLPWL